MKGSAWVLGEREALSVGWPGNVSGTKGAPCWRSGWAPPSPACPIGDLGITVLTEGPAMGAG